jgi:predicted aconitase with swiveling domain
MEEKILKGRTIVKGYAKGKALVTSQPLSFMGSVNPKTGQIIEQGHELEGQYLKDSIFVFPFSKGSTGGSYMLYDVVKNGVGPRGIINADAEAVCVIGAIVADLPMVDKIDVTQIKTGDYVCLNASMEDAVVEVVSD